MKNSRTEAAPITLHYRRQFYQESATGSVRSPGTPAGLVGREVANREFLRALLRHGRSSRIDFLVHEPADGETLQQLLKENLPATKQARLIPLSAIRRWHRSEGSTVLWQPQPIDARWAWQRQRMELATSGIATGSGVSGAGRLKIALCGVTHTMCTPAAAKAVSDLVASPVRPNDCLVCPGESVRHTAEALLEHATATVAGNTDAEVVLPRLQTIPLGVDTTRHQPATPSQRADMRRRLGIPQESRVALFVGRLSAHAKANPLPLFAACQHAAVRSDRRIDLILAGWFANPRIRQSFISEAARVAPNIHTQVVDGTDIAYRDCVWHAADCFVSLADSVQETFGLTVVEAMSRGLPVLASDWNGYRETIRHQQDGLLVPTRALPKCPDDILQAMHEGHFGYNECLAAIGQTVEVDVGSAAESLSELLGHPERARAMGDSARRRVLDQYDWSRIIGRYEDLWDALRLTPSSTSTPRRLVNGASATCLAPRYDALFQSYPSEWLDDSAELGPGDASMGGPEKLLASPLASHGNADRLPPDALGRLLARVAESGCVVLGQLLGMPSLIERDDDEANDRIRRSVMWCLKFGLLKVIGPGIERKEMEDRDARNHDVAASVAPLDLTYALTCMGRLAHLKQTLPLLVRHGRGRIVVVDYSCPDGSGDWIESRFDTSAVRVVRIDGRSRFDRSDAKNHAIRAAESEWVALIDADVQIAESFADALQPLLVPGVFVRVAGYGRAEGLGGTFVARRADLAAAGWHDTVYQDWGEEDEDLIEALKFSGLSLATIDHRHVCHLDHDDSLRTKFHCQENRRFSHMSNRIYRAAKWDLAKLTGEVPDGPTRRRLYDLVSEQVRESIEAKSDQEVVIDAGRMNWTPLAIHCDRRLSYRLSAIGDAKAGAYAKS